MELQNLAIENCSTSVDQPVAPIDVIVPDDQDRFDQEIRENRNRQKLKQFERRRHKNRFLSNFERL